MISTHLSICILLRYCSFLGYGMDDNVNNKEIDDDFIQQILRHRYKENIEIGKIGSSVYSAKLLMYSNDVAMDFVTEELNDWQCLVDNMRPNV